MTDPASRRLTVILSAGLVAVTGLGIAIGVLLGQRDTGGTPTPDTSTTSNSTSQVPADGGPVVPITELTTSAEVTVTGDTVSSESTVSSSATTTVSSDTSTATSTAVSSTATASSSVQQSPPPSTATAGSTP